MTCPEVVTDTGLVGSDPCNGALCLPWYLTTWRDAADREMLIAQRLSHLMSEQERTALKNAAEDLLRVGIAWHPLLIGSTVRKLAIIAKAIRCLWFEAATRARGNPPPATNLLPNKTAQRQWWTKWLPDLSDFAPSLSWPSLPGFDIDFKSIWEKLKEWFRVALPWVIAGVALWLFLPTLVRSAKEAIR